MGGRIGEGCRRAAAYAGLALAVGWGAACAGDGLEGVLRQAGIALPAGELDEGTIARGLRQALEVGTRRAVSRTAVEDGFLGNQRIRIPVPESLEPMASALRRFGLGAQVDELEVAMNRAAERAAGEAADVLLAAVRSMTLADARQILEGGDTAATEYFRRTTRAELRTRFEPIVAEKMQAVGLARLYDGLVARYEALPIPKQPAPDLQEYVTDRALDGLFTSLAEEEQRIRADPAARTTELLRRVFGASRASD
jgi:hypothetical protein